MPLAMHVCAHSYLIKPPWASNGHKLFLFSINFLLSVVPKINNSECSVLSHIVPLVKLVAPRSLLLCTYVTIYITALSPSLPPLKNFTLILMSSHDLMFPLFPPALSWHFSWLATLTVGTGSRGESSRLVVGEVVAAQGWKEESLRLQLQLE